MSITLNTFLNLFLYVDRSTLIVLILGPVLIFVLVHHLITVVLLSIQEKGVEQSGGVEAVIEQLQDLICIPGAPATSVPPFPFHVSLFLFLPFPPSISK